MSKQTISSSHSSRWEPLLSSFLHATILEHSTFQESLAFVLSNRLANAVMLPTQLFETFYEVLISHPDVRQGALADVEACKERVSRQLVEHFTSHWRGWIQLH